MLTKKLLAALGLVGALLVGATTDASANPWRGPHRHPVRVVVAPVYQAPVYVPPPAPVVVAPAYQPAPRVVVYQAPAHRPVGWRHPHRHHGRHW